MSQSVTAATPKALIAGAGIGGIATSIRLACQGYAVEVFEANPYPGGKLTVIELDGYRFDAGPSLFTMPQNVDDLFLLAGRNPRDYFNYKPLDPITNYFWPDGLRLSAWANPGDFANEVEKVTQTPAGDVLKALRKSQSLWDLTHHVFLERSLHKLDTYLKADTVRSILQLYKLDPFRSMHQANAARFSDPRLAQLFDRYATYNGSDPYQAPATLNIIPHLEYHLGAWFPVGGMHAIPTSLVKLARELGVKFHFGQPVDQILVENGQAVGLKVAGEVHPADLIVSNADVVPTYRKLLPDQPAPEKTLKQPRSSSALIFYWGMDREYPELEVHNILFSADYQKEFRQIWKEKTIDDDPTVYIHISSKAEPGDAPPGGENWFVMINVPSDQGQDWDRLIPQARETILNKIESMLGKPVRPHIGAEDHLEPRLIQSRTSSFGGALYGSSSNNPFAAFLRHPNFTRKIKNLYFVGGSVHPGGGIPLCLLSARIVGDLVDQKS